MRKEQTGGTLTRPRLRSSDGTRAAFGLGKTARLARSSKIALMNAASVTLMVVLSASQQTPPSQQAQTTSTETYESVDIAPDGNLRIQTSVQRTIIVPKGGSPSAGDTFGKQTAFEKPVVSEDRRAVGAQALFGNCCTSYDIPLQLVIYSNGKTHRFEGGLAIFDWHFADGGRRVVFSQQTVHFTCSVHWELRDVASERLVAEADIPEVCGQDQNPPKVKVPSWVTGAVSGFK
jgi:hypothetical protein